MFTLAMIQMRVEGGQIARNLAHASEQIDRAAGEGASVMLLPEVLDTGWTHPSAASDAGAIPDGRSCRSSCADARRNGVYVVAGIAERDGAMVYNSAVIIDPTGAVLIRHRKLNELHIAHDCYAQGDRLNVCHTPLGTFGLLICADANADAHTLGRSLGMMGAGIILSPTSWAVPPGYDNAAQPYGDTWRASYTPVARDYSLWYAGVSNVGPVSAGPWEGWSCIGCSLLVDPDGNEVVQGPFGVDAETIIYREIDIRDRPARGTSWGAYRDRLKK